MTRNCKSCIHHDVCVTIEVAVDKDDVIPCEDFLDKSAIYRPPCRLGDTVYSNCHVTGYYMRKSDAPYAYKVCFIGLSDCDAHGGGFVNVLHENGSMLQFNFLDFGKTVFLDREAALEA